MASFELLSDGHDGHIRTLAKAIAMLSRVSKEALLDFSTDKLRLCARTDMLLVKFTFSKQFFDYYHCDKKTRCFVNLKALSMPFKSWILIAPDTALRTKLIRVRCRVEDEINKQIIFKIGGDPPSATLTYRQCLLDMEDELKEAYNAINRSIAFYRIEISPKQNKREKFLLSAFNNFAPDIDQVTIKPSPSEIKFIGSTGFLRGASDPMSSATSEFTHGKDDFAIYNIKEPINVTVPLKNLKIFLNFVETNKIQTFPKYVFEGEGSPAHFMYDAQFYKAHFVTATPIEWVPEEILPPQVPAIGYEPNESFIADDNVIQVEDENHTFDSQTNQYYNDDIEEEDEYGYNDNESDPEEFMDGNLENIRPTLAGTSYNDNSICGTEISLRSEIKSTNVTYDPDKFKEIFDIDQDPDEIERRDCVYSSDEE